MVKPCRVDSDDVAEVAAPLFVVSISGKTSVNEGSVRSEDMTPWSKLRMQAPVQSQITIAMQRYSISPKQQESSTSGKADHPVKGGSGETGIFRAFVVAPHLDANQSS